MFFKKGAIALCLLQQTQALTEVQSQAYSGEASAVAQDNTVTPKADSLQTTSHDQGLLTSTVHGITNGLRKRNLALGNLLESLSDITDLLDLADGGLLDLSLLDLDLVQGLVGNLVNSITALVDSLNLLETVDEVLQSVLDLVENVLKQVLNLLLDDGLLKELNIENLDLSELLDKIIDLKLLDQLKISDSKSILKVEVIQNLLESVTSQLDLLDGSANNGLVKKVLEAVAQLLNQLLGAASKTPVAGAAGTKRGVLRREVVKYNIAKRSTF
ncbi:unnamed protein product [Cunninghamella blakesleeana]